MTRLIDAKELKEYLEEAYEAGCINKYYNMQRRTIFDEVLDCVDEQPTVDAVPVDFIRSEIERMKKGSNRYYSECEAYAEDLDILLMEWERRQ